MDQTIAQFRQRLETAVGCDAPMQDGALTVNRLSLLFLRHAESYYPKRQGQTESANFREALRIPAILYGQEMADAFGPLQLRACRQWMIEAGWARSTVNCRVRRVRHVWKWAVSVGLLKPEALAGLQAVPGLRRGQAKETPPVMPVPLEWIRQTAQRCIPTVAAMLNVHLLGACRPGEIVTLSGRHMDTSRSSVWLYKPPDHKNAFRGHLRTIYFGPRAIAILRPLLTPGFIFVTRLGGPYSTNTYSQAVRKACRLAGVPHFCVGQIRHTAATMIRAELGIEAAQAMLGHARIETTQIYAEQDAALGISTAQRFG